MLRQVGHEMCNAHMPEAQWLLQSCFTASLLVRGAAQWLKSTYYAVLSGYVAHSATRDPIPPAIASTPGELMFAAAERSWTLIEL